MNFILEKILEIEDVSQRRAKAIELLERFDNPYCSNFIPRGYFVREGRFPDAEIARRELEEDGARVFDGLREFFGEDVPDIFRKIVERFERNKEHMVRLCGLDEVARCKLPIAELPPFFDDFDRQLRLGVERGWFDIPFRDMKFSPDCIGKGGMADIYAAEDSSGSRLALKLFRPNYAVDRFARDGWSRRVHHILENVYDLRSVVNKAPFIPLRGIVHASCSPNWYVMDRFDGRSVASVLDAGEELDRGAKHRVVIAYANMLKGLHSQGLLFKDNNWGAVLFNADSVAICDYDMVSRQDELNSGDHFARLVRTPIFCSREDFLTDLPFTCQSELESFALMIDRLILGTYYLGDGYENRMKYEQEAKTYERQYIDLRSAKLPPNLRDVVAGLLNYPRDDSLTVDDFISATDMDLG